MKQKIFSDVTLTIVTIALAIVVLFSFSFWPNFFKTNNYRNLPEITSQGDGTHTMKNGDAVMLNNGISISFNKVNNKDQTGYIKQTGMDTSILEYPSGTEVGVWLVVNESRFIFLSPTNSEQQIIERGNITDFTHPGAVMKLISLDKDKGEATISFRSITGNINLNNPFLAIPLAVIIIAILVFVAEFIIKSRSTNVLYRYTFYRSIIYTIPFLLLISFSDPEWGIIVAIFYFPIIFIDSILASSIAYKVVIKKKYSG